MKPDTYQYRITVNGCTGPIKDNSSTWGNTTDIIDSRGGIATLERRFVTTHDFLELIEDHKGHIKLKNNMLLCPWEIIAQVESR
jgi:hypothetical protein